jgi:hypothetical protein
MRINLILIILFILFEACGNPVKVKVESVTIQEIEVDTFQAPPPPPIPQKLSNDELEKKSGSVAPDEMSFVQWLQHICHKEPKSPDIVFYHFGLFDTDKTTMIYLTGSKEKNINTKDWKGINEYEPEFKYFDLGNESFYNSDDINLQENIEHALKQFISSREFKLCFLKTATQITFGFDSTTPQRLK